MEEMNEKEHDIDTVELFEKENESNNEDLIREEPINEGNNEGEIIIEESKLEILIGNELEIGKREIIENEVSDEVSSDEDRFEEEFDLEIDKSEIVENEVSDEVMKIGYKRNLRKK